jgi:hypothetical protein
VISTLDYFEQDANPRAGNEDSASNPEASQKQPHIVSNAYSTTGYPYSVRGLQYIQAATKSPLDFQGGT